MEIVDIVEAKVDRSLAAFESSSGYFLREDERGARRALQLVGGKMASLRGTSASEHLAGTELIDDIVGNGGDDLIEGKEGDDILDGNSGNDTIFGGEGNDLLLGNSGNDVISDAGGNDTVDAGTGDDVVQAGSGDDSFTGGQGFDTIDFSGSASSVRVDLSKGTASGDGSDKVQGFEAIVGSTHGDMLRGDAADNTIDGGKGSDRIRGAEGNDTLTGGEGRDTFAFKSRDVFGADGDQRYVDVITDFGNGFDGLDVRELLAGVTYDTYDQVLQVTETAEGTTVAVNQGAGFVDVALLQGVSFGGAEVWSLAADGLILA